MSAQHWHKRYHSDALTGFMSLTLEERGAYQTILDMIYDRGGPIVNNDRLLAGYMGVSVRKWAALRDTLITKGKIVIDGEFIINERAIFEIEKAAKTARKLAENGSKGGRNKSENAKKDNENKEDDLAPLEQNPSLSRYQIPEEAKASSAREPIDIAALAHLLSKAAGLEMPDPGRNYARHSEVLTLVTGWVDAGADPVKMEECVAARAASMPSPARSLKYFDMPITAMIAQKVSGDTEAQRLIRTILEQKDKAA